MKKYLNLQYIGFIALMAMQASANAQAAGATGKGIGNVLDGIRTTQMGNVANFLASLAFVVGVGLGLAGLFKLREYFQEPDRHTLAAPIGYLLVASLAIGLPQFLKMGQDTVGITGNTTADSATATIGTGATH